MATSEPSAVIFQRGQDDDEDAWDDTALIKAYDTAISAMKTTIAERIGEPVGNPSKDTSKKRKKKKNKGKKKKAHSQSSRIWRVGDSCRAIYSADGYEYDAVIKSIDSDNGTCIVLYTDYGNEEEQELVDLMQLSSLGSIDTASDFSSDMGNIDRPSLRGSSRRPPKGQSVPDPQSMKRQPTHHNGMPPPAGAMPPPFFPGMAPSMFPPSFPMMPPMFPQTPMPPFATSWPGLTADPHPKIPMVPPPPPANTDDLEGDNEALHSMLIAWYMSGYHTGYYQGLKQAKKKCSTPDSSTAKRERADGDG